MPTLKRLLELRNRTQVDMARETGLSRQKIIEILNGRNLNITLDTLFSISKFLGTSDDKILAILKSEMRKREI